MTDPIGDFITRLRNAQHGRRTDCRAPWSRIKQGIADLLRAEGFVQDARVEGEGIHREVVVTFRTDRAPLQLARVSRPGSRTYVGADEIRPHLHGALLAILSTSKGLLSHAEAKKQRLGGEILCTVS